MSHLPPDTLWALAQAEAPEAPAAAHLAGCPACREALEDVRRAQLALAALPPAPPLPPAVAARVGAALAEAADLAAARRAPWWRALLGRPLALAGAAAVVVLAAWGLAGLPGAPGQSAPAAPVARTEPVPAPPAPVAAAAPGPAPAAAAPPPPVPAPRRRASVASARKAHVREQPAAVAQVLEEGDRLRTDRGGALWLKLPDGSRAGLTGSTSVVLTRLEDRALELEVGQGSLALVVPHRLDRTLTVRAGEVEVVDLGTRFSVSRSGARVLVAVEEGEVEVRAGGAVQRVGAGRALSAHQGRVATFPWAPVLERPASPAGPGSAAEPEPAPEPAFVPSEAARLSGEDEAEAAPPPPAATPAPARPGLVRPDLDWADLPAGERPAPPPPPAPSVPAALATTATPPASRLRTAPAFSLEELERRVRSFQQGLNEAIVVPARREALMREVVRKAGAGSCGAALVEADQWLGEAPSIHPAEPDWRREVLSAQARCAAHRRP